MLKLKMDLTSRDKKLLIFLSLFVVAIFFIYVLIIPLGRSNMEIKEKIDVAKAEKIENEQKMQALPAKRESLETLRIDLAEIRNDFYPFMQSQEIDQKLTGMALSYGVFSRNLNIVMPEGEAALEPYQYSEAAQNNAEEAKEEKKTDPEEITDKESAQKSAPETRSNSKAKGTGLNMVYTDIYKVKISWDLTGLKQNLKNLVDNLSFPALRLVSLKWDQTDDDRDALSLNLELYMYKD